MTIAERGQRDAILACAVIILWGLHAVAIIRFQRRQQFGGQRGDLGCRKRASSALGTFTARITGAGMAAGTLLSGLSPF